MIFITKKEKKENLQLDFLVKFYNDLSLIVDFIYVMKSNSIVIYEIICWRSSK